MKRLISLLLSMLLVFSLVPSVGAEPELLGNAGTLANVFDTTGRIYDEYKAELSEDIWSATNINRVVYPDEPTAFNATYTRADKQSSMRFVVSPHGSGKATSGVHLVQFKMYAEKEKADGTIDFAKGYIIANRRQTAGSSWDGEYSLEGLMAKKWYDIKIVFDLDADTPHSTFTVTDVETGEVVRTASLNTKSTDYTNMWFYITYTAGTTEVLLFKDIKVVTNSSKNKLEVTSIGSDGSGILPFDQNKVQFTVDREPVGLEKKHVSVVKAQSGEIGISELNITSDASAPEDEKWIVELILDQDLVTWSEYEIIIKSDYYDGCKLVGDISYEDVTDTVEPFATASAPIDMRTPAFSSDGSFTTDLASTQGNTDMTFIYVNIASDDYIKEIKTIDFHVDGNQNGVTLGFDNGFAEGDTAKLFVINGWGNPTALFNKSWVYKYDGTTAGVVQAIPATDVEANEIILDTYSYDTEFDYDNNKISLSLNSGTGAATEGILYVYKEGTLGGTNLPIYADYITTAQDGTIKKDIKFAPSVTATSETYLVEFQSADTAGVISTEFEIFNNAKLAEHKEGCIFNLAKAANTYGGLKQAILGINANEEIVGTNFDVFSAKADTTKYNSLRNKDAVFTAMVTKLDALADFDDLVELFEKEATAQYNAENKTASSPSSDNKGYGGSSVSMKESVSSSPAPSAPSNGSQTSLPGALFTDMNGHWAEKFVEKLSARGIMKGYDDGTFKGQASITRAELAKTIVEALEISGGKGAAFADVADGSWYASYIEKASAAGIINGYADGTFAPDLKVSRQDAVLMLYRAMKQKKDLPTGYTFFADDFDIQDYASDAVRCLGELGIITGDGNKNFKPLSEITRAEVATVICRALDYIEAH